MYLKRIEMQGFKSFADKTVLEFKPGITTVIDQMVLEKVIYQSNTLGIRRAKYEVFKRCKI